MKRIAEFENDRIDMKQMSKVTGGQVPAKPGNVTVVEEPTAGDENCPNGDIMTKIYTDFTIDFWGTTRTVRVLTDSWINCS